MIERILLCLVAFAAILPAAEEYSFWIEPCTPETARATSCEPGDPELGRWALESWQREAGGAIALKKSPTEDHARLRLQENVHRIGHPGMCRTDSFAEDHGKHQKP